MVVKDLDALIEVVKKSSDEDAKRMIVEYGNARVKTAIERAWEVSHKWVSFVLRKRKQELQGHILDFGNPNKVVGITSFTKYFASVEDELILQSKNGSREVRKALESVQDTMYNNLENIKIDRRRLYKKE